MVEYIKGYIDIIVKAFTDKAMVAQMALPEAHRIESPQEGFRQVAKELDRLDPRDFEPAVRTQFLRLRGNVSYWCTDGLTLSKVCAERSLLPLKAILDEYRGASSGGVTRQFAFLSDPGLRAIVERDYAELVVKVYPSGAWKSTVILAGSILEAILFDRLADAKWNTAALMSSEAPKNKKTGPIPLDDWRLEALINVSVDIGVMEKDPADTIHQVLRDYRNFVHPKKEIRAAHACKEAEAMLAVGALDSVCNYIEAHP